MLTGLCVWLIIRPEESYRECVVMEYDCEASIMRRAWPTTGCCAMGKKEGHMIGIQCIIFIQICLTSVLAHFKVFWYLLCYSEILLNIKIAHKQKILTNFINYRPHL
jgi:hypothetical protein